MKILVVDDNVEITDLFNEYLTAKGHNCTVANDGMTGLGLLERNHYDMTLLDIAMPEMTGFEVISALEKNGKLKEQTIIVLTASDIVKNEDIERMKKQGIKAFLKKPVKLDLLIKEIGLHSSNKN
jgi:CheY-like chemotaxis protein